jgi:hypothetical protein
VRRSSPLISGSPLSPRPAGPPIRRLPCPQSPPAPYRTCARRESHRSSSQQANPHRRPLAQLTPCTARPGTHCHKCLALSLLLRSVDYSLPGPAPPAAVRARPIGRLPGAKRISTRQACANRGALPHITDALAHLSPSRQTPYSAPLAVGLAGAAAPAPSSCWAQKAGSHHPVEPLQKGLDLLYISPC